MRRLWKVESFEYCMRLLALNSKDDIGSDLLKNR